ncbi:MAG: hypothetical protein H0T46_30675 [Deltaproteobacteria bacterium]|nr:hypothetical protein [Deltaproteobacteria bacterium]
MRKGLGAFVLALVAGAACSSPAPEDRPSAGSNARVAQDLANIVATCAEASDTVQVRRRGQPHWERVTVGMTFRERDWVRTGPGSFARIRILDRGFVELRENTTILVDTAITVEGEPIVGEALAGAPPMTIRAADGTEATITAQAWGSSARFRVTPSSDKGIEIAVTGGQATVTTAGTERVLGKGQATDISTNRAGDVVTLLAYPRSLSPGVDARFQFAAERPTTLTWATVPEAARYLVQVSRDTDFRSLVVNKDVTRPTATFVAPADGTYAWRVAARDASGRLGEFGFARRIFFEVEVPRDLLIAPRNDARYGFGDSPPRIVFSWQSAGDATRYKLVVHRASDPNGNPVAEISTDQQQLEVATLGEGAYLWGVYAVRRGSEQPVFIEPRVVTIRKQRVKANTDELWK